MSFLLFGGLLVAPALLALNVFGNTKEQLQPVPVRVRARNGR